MVTNNLLNVLIIRKLVSLFLTCGCISLVSFSAKSINAETINLPSDAPLELELLNQKQKDIITSKTIDRQKLTIPSLWWVKENSEKKLLSDWIVYPATESENPRVDVLVNYQVWSVLDYFEKYSFLNRLGTIASKFNYNIRVFNYQQEPLATYTCNFIKIPMGCKMQINAQNKVGSRY